MSGFDLGPALLFCPADRPERFRTALERSDGVIIDLEDAVSPEAKTAARGALIDAELDATRVIVRVNPVGTPDFDADLATLSQTDVRTIMVAKAESPKRIGRIDPRYRVIALCETARGVLAAERIAALENVTALMWGAEDLVASLGGTSSRKANGRYRDVARHARAQVLLAAGARGKAAIDAVHLDIADAKGLAREAADAAASGFAATACIHPSQVPTIREAYRPDATEVQWGRDLLAAAVGKPGVFAFRGRMVDEPVLRHARTLVRRAQD
ncbi:CoA ester lyase [Microbacterium sp. zg.Y1090]|uniref:HpcH/HpaI aldolase/citrate lyase family protein n=1 Tax=Microbacterium TaxID=33882 RepID=UPI00214C1B57|nr:MULTISPECIES: CoA ester lyase [unclassified Microbacterium]MCR2811976.1 CoA ester lyase [Microbacterium sp. zg.Y1084]MCR2818585.1 CoA ester lyase [Microbacterium sp. zg.Y1090]MDL5486399.1 CoA ester lyase [Microbacterium sp. zg-Y1211]WIM29589.1 CoA ester lyase [Microbacterium sp. zg-Y1090]